MSADYLKQLPEGVTWPGFSEKDYSLIAEPLRVSASQREFRSWLCDITLEYFWTREFYATTGTPAQRAKDAKAIAKAACELSDLLDGKEKLAITIFDFADPDRDCCKRTRRARRVLNNISKTSNGALGARALRPF
jgi:hypothetical protein